MSFHMVVPWIGVPIPKTQVSWPNTIKEALFLHFLCPSVKNSNGRQSDNFGPRRSAYGPSESLCPKFSKTHLRKVSIVKIMGATPLQSQVIQICVPQKRCLSAVFLEKILFLTHFEQIFPPWYTLYIIHQRKDVHLSVPHVLYPHNRVFWTSKPSEFW